MRRSRTSFSKVLAWVAVTVGAVIAPLIVGYGLRLLYPPPAPVADARIIETHLYGVSVREIKVPTVTDRGALTQFGGYLIVSGRRGELFQVSPDEPAAVTRLPFDVPLSLSSSELSKFDERTLSVLDLEAITDQRGETKLYASYLDYAEADRCMTIVLASRRIEESKGPTGAAEIVPLGEWSAVFRTSPCISIDMLWPGSLFGGGGRIEPYRGDLLFSVGSLGVDGTGGDPAVSQLMDYDYGKVLRLSASDASRTFFSTGHRNPQGLLALVSGTVLETEHGPKGGDEINALVEGGNYGWPLVTYGTNYDSFDWEQNSENGRHEGFRKPLISFVPSIGISELVEVTANAEFPEWEGDVLVASLRDQTIFRCRYEAGRIVYVEPIRIKKRLRDIAMLVDGRIALLASTGEVLIIANGNSLPSAPDTPEAR